MRKGSSGSALSGSQILGTGSATTGSGSGTGKVMDEKSKKDMTGFFQGLINKGNTKKIAERKLPTASSGLGLIGGGPDRKMPSLDPSLVGNNGLTNGNANLKTQHSENQLSTTASSA